MILGIFCIKILEKIQNSRFLYFYDTKKRTIGANDKTYGLYINKAIASNFDNTNINSIKMLRGKLLSPYKWL